jgi:hypothetical protein
MSEIRGESAAPVRSAERDALALWCARFAESEVELERLHAAETRAQDELDLARDGVIAAERVLEEAEKGRAHRELQELLGSPVEGPSVGEAQTALEAAEADSNRARQFVELAARHIEQAERRRAVAAGGRDDALRALIAAERPVLDEWLALFDKLGGEVASIAEIFRLLSSRFALPKGFPIWDAINREFPAAADPPLPRWQAALAALAAGEVDAVLPRPEGG